MSKQDRWRLGLVLLAALGVAGCAAKKEPAPPPGMAAGAPASIAPTAPPSSPAGEPTALTGTEIPTKPPSADQPKTGSAAKGTLHARSGKMTLDLAAADGSRYVHAVIGKTKVAAGEYQVRSLKQEKTDDHGVTWTLAGSWYKEGPTLTVEDGKPVEASFGPPLKPQVKAAPEKARPGTQVSLAFTFTGQGGEEYRAGNVMRSNKRPPEPRFEIVDANDKVVASGKFHYG